MFNNLIIDKKNLWQKMIFNDLSSFLCIETKYDDKVHHKFYLMWPGKQAIPIR